MSFNDKKPDFVVRERKAPAHRESEINCLGLCLKYKEALVTITGKLVPTDFFYQEHVTAYQVISELFNGNKHVDPNTVGDELNKRGLLGSVGGQVFLNNLYDVGIGEEYAEELANSIKQWSVIRSIQKLNDSINSIIASGDISDPQSIIETQMSGMLEATQAISKGGLEEIPLTCRSLSESIEEAFHNKRSNTGIPTGLVGFDKMTGGLEGEQMILLAAQSTLGKTSMALQIAQNIASDQRLPVVIFSLETNKFRLMRRMAASRAGVNAFKLREGKISSEEHQAVQDAILELQNLPIYVDDASRRFSEIKSSTLRFMAKYGAPGLVVIDYFGLVIPMVQGVGGKAYEAHAALSQEFRRFAHSLPCPMIMIAQTNRNAQNRRDQTPIINDLAHTSQLGYDADMLLFLHVPQGADMRPNAQGPHAQRMEEVAPHVADDTIHLIIAKQKDGPQGVVPLKYDKAKFQFRDIDNLR